MIAHDDGVVCAPTAFGKTAVAAWLIANRNVPRLFWYIANNSSINGGSDSRCSSICRSTKSAKSAAAKTKRDWTNRRGGHPEPLPGASCKGFRGGVRTYRRGRVPPFICLHFRKGDERSRASMSSASRQRRHERTAIIRSCTCSAGRHAYTMSARTMTESTPFEQSSIPG